MSVEQSAVDLFLVSVPVSGVIVARLSPLTLEVATLVRPAFYMDTHHVAAQGRFIHEAFTTVGTEKPLVGVVLMCGGQMEVQVLDNFPTQPAGLWVVNSGLVSLLVIFIQKYFITFQTGQLTGDQRC